MRRAVRLVLLASASLLIVAAAPPQSQWRRLDSPNFIVIGEVGASQLRDIAVKFEGFRETLGRVLNERVTSTAVPTVVIVFRGDATFNPFKPKYQGKRVDVGGLFVARRNVNHIAMVSDGNDDRLRVIFHEYAHLLISNTGQRVPVWLNEGLAEYYSTFELQRGGREAVIGRIIEGHLQDLNQTTLLKLPELLNITHDSPLYNEGSRRSVFYAQAWALTHFIFRNEPSLAAQLGEYLGHLSRGMAPTDAWSKAFGSQDVARGLEQYIRRRAYTATLYKFTDKLATFEAEAVSVPPAEVHAYLAGFLADTDRPEDARAELAVATKIDARNARAGIAAAFLSLDAGDHAAAERQVGATGSSPDWFLNYLAGLALVESAEGGDAAPSVATLTAARNFFKRARADRSEFANALARMASLELRSPGVPTEDTRTDLERAITIAPGRHEYAMLLAQTLARQSEFAAARGVLGPMMTPLYPERVRDAARRLMELIVDLEARRTPGASRAGSASAMTGSAPPPSDTTGAGTEPVTRPVFRELKPGEERLEGTLESIECVAGKGITFRVKTATEPVAVTSPDFASVDFISYRSDLKGSIQCGPVKPALPVFVTYRAGAITGSRVAVAIEFPPR
jgi:hypothetical protein